MKFKTITLSVLAALSLGVTTSAMAADAAPSTTATNAVSATHAMPAMDQSGWWVGGALGMAYIGNHDSAKFDGANNAPSYKVDGGYDFNQYVGLYGSFDNVHDLGNAKNLNIGTLGVKGNLPLTQKLSAFGKVGASYVYNDRKSISHMKSGNWSATAGLGLSYQLTHAISTQVGADFYQGLRTKSGHADLTQAYWGMTYKFGQPATPMVINNTMTVVKEVAVETMVPTRSTYVLPYQTGSAKLDDYARYNLNQVVATMQANPEVTAKIIGRADKVGPAAVNAKISKERAAGVAQFLESNGIDASRLTVSAVSTNQPLKAPAADQSQNLQRSVEIVLN